MTNGSWSGIVGLSALFPPIILLWIEITPVFRMWILNFFIPLVIRQNIETVIYSCIFFGIIFILIILLKTSLYVCVRVLECVCGCVCFANNLRLILFKKGEIDKAQIVTMSQCILIVKM